MESRSERQGRGRELGGAGPQEACSFLRSLPGLSLFRSRSFALALSLSLFHFPAVAGACLCFAVKHGFIYKQTRGLRDVQREERGAQGTEGSSGWVPPESYIAHAGSVQILMYRVPVALCVSTAAPRQGISLQAGPARVQGPHSAVGRFWLTCSGDPLAAGSAAGCCPRNTTRRPCCPQRPRTASTGRAGRRPSASASACASAAAACWANLPAIPTFARQTSVKTPGSAPRKRLGPRGGVPRAGSRR